MSDETAFDPTKCACNPDIWLSGYTGGAAPEGLYGKLYVRIEGQPEWVAYVPARDEHVALVRVTPLTNAQIDAIPFTGFIPATQRDHSETEALRRFARSVEQVLVSLAQANVTMLREALEELMKYGYLKPSPEAMDKARNALEQTK